MEQQQQSLLPSLTLVKFTGDPLEYSTFTRSFELQVEARVGENDVSFAIPGTILARRTKTAHQRMSSPG